MFVHFTGNLGIACYFIRTPRNKYSLQTSVLCFFQHSNLYLLSDRNLDIHKRDLLRLWCGDNFQIVTASFEKWETLSLSVSIELKKFQFCIFFEVGFYTFHSLPEHHKQRQNTLTTVETSTMQHQILIWRECSSWPCYALLGFQ